MKRSLKSLLAVVALMGTIAVNASSSSCLVTPYYQIRSQSSNNARKNAGMANHTNLFDQDGWYGTFNVTPGYSRSFRPSKITCCLFGNFADKCGDVRVQGSRVADRCPNALLADYFYLPTDFDSTFNVDPRISNAWADFQFYAGMDKWWCNSYFRIYAPVVRTKWDLNFCETVCATGTLNHDPGYFTPCELDRSSLLSNACEYFQGCSPDNVTETIATGTNVTIQFRGLNAARICGSQTKTALADLRAELGWNFLNDDDYHFGVNIQFAAPTGNAPEACFLFEPIVGNGKHFELGGGLSGHFLFWRSDDEECTFGIYFDANITHMFKKRQRRTFDLCGKPLSRYMLAMRMGTPIIGDLQGNVSNVNTDASSQFKFDFTPVANISTVDIDSTIGVQGDVAIWLNYTSGNTFSWDIGYNFWGRSCEKLRCPCPSQCDPCACDPCDVVCPSLCDPCDGENVWALKGDAQVFGFDVPAVIPDPFPCSAANAVPLSGTQSGAQICSGKNYPSTGASTEPSVNTGLLNAGVDNNHLAIADFANGNGADDVFSQFNDDSVGREVNTSIQPVFINCCDLDLCTTTRGISHKIWSHLQWNWDNDCWQPYIGVGGEAEFGKSEDCCDPCKTSCSPCDDSSCSTSCDPCCDPCKSDCMDCALSQWSVWVRLGFSFS